MGKKGIPLHEAGEVLGDLVANNPPVESTRIELDQSPETAHLPVAGESTGKRLEINSILLDERAQEETESYAAMRELYDAGELTAQDIRDSFLDPAIERFFRAGFEHSYTKKGKKIPATKDAEFVSPDRTAAERLLAELESEQPRSAPSSPDYPKSERTRVWVAEGEGPKPKPEGERWRDQPEHSKFLELCQEYTKGMSLKQIKHQFHDRSKYEAERRVTTKFLTRVGAGFNPSAYLMNEILLVQPGLKEKELSQQDWKKANEHFLKATREVWGPFAYSGKWQKDRRTGEYKISEGADLDARVSLMLLEQAKLNKVLLDVAVVPPGEFKPGATTIDSGLRSGVTVEGDGTVIIDNHQRGRGYETSSAKILYNLLLSRGDISRSGPLRALVELTVRDDNARFITKPEEFNSSDRTIRGLHRFMDAPRLLEFLEQQWAPAARAVDAPRERSRDGGETVGIAITNFILDKKLSDAELKQWSLTAAAENQRRTIDHAHELLLDVPEESLQGQGRVVDTRLGKFVLNIEGMEEADRESGKKWFDGKKFKGGHDTVNADGRFQGYLSWDERNQSILLNTTNRDFDLTLVLQRFMAKHPELVPVRGALIIKPKNGKPLTFTLPELLADLGVDVKITQGQLKQYLERGLPQPKEKQPKQDRRGKGGKEKQHTSITQGENVIPPVAVALAPDIKKVVVESPPANDVSLTSEKPQAHVENTTDVPPARSGTSKTYSDAWKSVNRLGSKNLSSEEYDEAQRALRTLGFADKPIAGGRRTRVTKAQEELEVTSDGAQANIQVEDHSTEVQQPAASVPPIEREQPEAEGWADETGIKFMRELTPDEQRVKDEIDDTVRNRLAAKARELLNDPDFTDESDRDAFVDVFVEDGLRYSAVIEKRVAHYRGRGLPLAGHSS